MNLKTKIFVDLLASVLLLVLVVLAVWLSIKKETLPQRVQQIKKMEKGHFSFSFYDMKGEERNLKDFKDRVVLVNLWATWCPPCIEELPSLLKLAQMFPDELIILAMTDEPLDIVEKFLSSFDSPGKNFIVALNADIKKLFYPDALPESYLFNKDLKMVLKIIGPRIWDGLDWQNKIKELSYGKKS